MSPSTDIRENREFASEIKFLVSPELACQIRDWARARLSPDPNADGPAADTYQITSLYFDTEAFQVFHRKGSYGRSKYRVRRYGQSGVVYLERKLKTRGLLAKRRSVVELGKMERLCDSKPERGWPGFWFHQRLLAREVRPVCQISYLRTARVAMTNLGPIRLTLDEDLCGQEVHAIQFSELTGELILKKQLVLELKYRYEMPVLFRNLVEEFALQAQPFSKYRLAVSSLGLVVPEPASPQTASVAYAGMNVSLTHSCP